MVTSVLSGPAGRTILQACRPHLIAIAVFSALINLLYIAPTLYMLQVYDRVVPTNGLETLGFLTIILLFALLTLALLDRARNILLVRAALQLDIAMGARILDVSLRRPQMTHARQSLRDFDSLRGAFSGPAFVALCDAPWMPFYIIVCALMSPWIALVAILGCSLLPLVAWLNEKATGARLVRARGIAMAANVQQESAVANADAVRALGMRRAFVARIARQRQAMLAGQAESGLAGGNYVALSKFVRLALQSLALALGALLAVERQISPGAIFASTFLISRTLAPLEQIITHWKSLQGALSALRDVDELLTDAEEAVLPTSLPRPKGAIRLESVVVHSAGRSKPTFQCGELSIAAGEVVAVIGPSGAGKSTFVRLLAGALRPDRGVIRFDGADTAHWDPEQLARAIGYSPQAPTLFAGTVAENIARFRGETGTPRAELDGEVVAAARKVAGHEMILALPGGYDYPLGFDGAGLSSGQAQRVALARAVYGDPTVLLLDEPNAHLDADGDTQLIETIATLKRDGRTILVVSHKLGILPVVDRILVIKDGEPALFGAREEIIARLGRRPGDEPRAPAQGMVASA